MPNFPFHNLLGGHDSESEKHCLRWPRTVILISKHYPQNKHIFQKFPKRMYEPLRISPYLQMSIMKIFIIQIFHLTKQDRSNSYVHSLSFALTPVCSSIWKVSKQLLRGPPNFPLFELNNVVSMCVAQGCWSQFFLCSCTIHASHNMEPEVRNCINTIDWVLASWHIFPILI